MPIIHVCTYAFLVVVDLVHNMNNTAILASLQAHWDFCTIVLHLVEGL